MRTQTVPGDTIPASTGTAKSARVKNFRSTMMTLVRKEPAAMQALVVALIAMGIAFRWWHWSDAQTGAVVGVAALLGMFVRSQVTPLIQSAARGRRLIPALDQTEAVPAPPVGR